MFQPRVSSSLSAPAQINALGNLSGFVFNYLIGWIQAETGSFPLALMPIAAVATVSTICVLVIGWRQPRTVP
jgi:ACS family tartrate transporter-like MFS transporter